MTIRLIKAAANNQNILVGQYLRAGDDINYQEKLYGQTALHCALKNKNHTLVNFLYNHCGANANIKDDQGFTAYDIADGTYDRAIDHMFTQQKHAQQMYAQMDCEYAPPLSGDNNTFDNYGSDYTNN